MMMAAQLSSAHLRKWADELDAEEREELEAAEREKIDRLASAPQLSEEEVEFLRRIKAELEQAEQEKEQAADAEQKEEPPAAEEGKPPPVEEEPPAARTRPGRRSGRAYDWTVDDDGEVVRDGVAHIYSGPDEPNQVELPVLREAEAGEETAAA